MKPTVLLVDYEPRNAARYGAALAPLNVEFLAATDLDGAIAHCSKVEPSVVLLTSVLPRVKVEDAILQLRARAGLRSTPFVILMSGYNGTDPRGDAQRLGAQDILPKPFSDQQLRDCVKHWLESGPRAAIVSEKTKVEILEALKQQGGEGGVVTSQELFGDILGEEEEVPSPADTQRIRVEPKAPAKKAETPAAPPQKAVVTPMKPPGPPRQVPAPKGAVEDVERVLEATIADVLKTEEKKPKHAEDTGTKRVEELLSQTLSGLEVPLKPKPTPAVRPAAPPPPEIQPARQEPPKPAAAQPAAPTGTAFGQYELIEHIATGGMAEVYKARMKGLEGFQKIVAIKRILPHLTDNDEFVTMFIDEAKLAAQLQHPNIIHIYDLGKIERSYYIAMEYIDGLDLRSILNKLQAKGERFPLPLALYVGARLADALDYAHRKRDFKGQAMALVHRDVSPQNVLISYEGEIKLCDFGIAKAASKASHTRAGALKGKLQYMSPEQAWGKDLDHRSDIFSLGLVLYEMIVGRKAFSGDSELSILEQVRSPKLVPPRQVDSTIPPEVEQILLKALKEKREERYQSAADMAKDLEAAMRAFEPTPSAAQLAAFLCDLQGRERPALATEAAGTVKLPVSPPPAKPSEPQPAQAPAPEPPKAKPAPAPVPPVTIPELEEQLPARRGPSPMVWAVPTALVIAAGAYFLLTRSKPGESPLPAPTPETQQVAQVGGQQMETQPPPAEEGTPRVAGQQPTPAPAVAPTVSAPPARTPIPTVAPPPAPTRPPVPTPTPAPAAAIPPAPLPPEPEPTLAPTPEPAPPPRPTPTPAPQLAQAPAPTVKEGDLVELPDVWPEPIVMPKPAYPPLAARQRQGGTVILSVLVDENGVVREVKVLRGVKPDLGFDDAAVSAVKNWRYKPATKDGVKVKTWFTQPIPFKPQ